MPASPSTGSPVTPTIPNVLPLYNPTTTPPTQTNTSIPPPQQTLIYAPDVRIIIRHNGIQYEISEDLVRGTVIRKENSASSMVWTCHNQNLRYTNAYFNQPLFSRMDAVTCYMKRAGNWIQVFTGYLDSIPYLNLYPGLVNFKATCTLKRLLCEWWNPGLPQSATLMNQYTSVQQEEGDQQKDSGLGSLLQELLVQVGGWNPINIHIQNFPLEFLTLLQSQLKQQQQNQAQADKFRQLLEGSVSTPAPGPMAGYNGGGAGMPGQYGSGMAFYVQEIVAACDQLGLGPNTKDLNLSQGIMQAGTEAEGSRDSATRAAGQQTQAVAKTYNTATRNSDAAILGVATAMVETGGGTTIRNLWNAQAPDSQNYLNDGEGFDGSSCGIFQQQNNWGPAAERMNPRQAASMFFARLSPNWANEDPGVACWNVQIAGDQTHYEAMIDSAIPLATQLVQQYRQTQASTSNSTVQTALAAPLANEATAGAAALGVSGNGALNTTAMPNISPTTMSVPANQRVGKPYPDSEGAINWERTQLGMPYVYGSAGPNSWDCSSLQQAAFRSIGVEIGRDTYTQATTGQRIPPQNIKRGDCVQPNSGHTTMWLGDGTILEAATESEPIHIVPAYFSPSSAYGIFRYCDNGGPDPSAPFNPPSVTGPGNPPYTGQTSVGGGGPGGVGGGAAGGGGEPIAQNLFSYIFTPQQFMNQTSLMYGAATPEKDFIDCQPLMQMVQSVAGASLRNFASAPNGDFIAYYPDYFGMDGKPAVFILEDIELKNFSLNFSDDALTTHVYVDGDYTMVGQTPQTMSWLATLGYATVENQQLYQRMRLVAPGDLEDMTGAQLLQRFGVRPLQITYGNLFAGELQFLLAVRTFMEKWSAQYQSAVSFTFMPDLFPGMRVLMSKHNVQVYVNEVTHNFDFEQGFTTDAVVTAPSNPAVRNLWAGSNSVIPAIGIGATPNTGTTVPTATTVNPLISQ